ncbi:hypothetical protein BY458DRAFT_492226 [Sporodiniella umbellata]|nr:hypothetical protein BY458DRAFT_492226 [Sporodiniella umbellata]
MNEKPNEFQKNQYLWKSLRNSKVSHRTSFKRTFDNLKKIQENTNQQNETTTVINSIQKCTENTRFQAKVAMEIFEELQGVLKASDQQQARRILGGVIETSKRLAVFGLTTAKSQERETKAFADKALNFPISIKHLETFEEE